MKGSNSPWSARRDTIWLEFLVHTRRCSISISFWSRMASFSATVATNVCCSGESWVILAFVNARMRFRFVPFSAYQLRIAWKDAREECRSAKWLLIAVVSTHTVVLSLEAPWLPSLKRTQG